MNNSVEVLKSIYKPYRYTIKGKATIIETTSGTFLIKEKKKELKELYEYLKSRGFFTFPNIIDASRKDVNVFEYIESINMPKEQKCADLIDELANLHNKTTYFKEVSIDHFKEIYEDIKSNIAYLKNYYNTLFEIGFKSVYPSPSMYELTRNFYKIDESLNFCSEELDKWFEIIKNEKKIRVAVVHNNLCLDHFIKGQKDAIISWDNYMFDTPIIDLVKLYKSEYNNMNFSEYLKKYLYKFPLLPYEEKLLFILISLPPEVKKGKTEYENTKNISLVLDYVFKTEELIRPYYSNENKEE